MPRYDVTVGITVDADSEMEAKRGAVVLVARALSEYHRRRWFRRRHR